ncbi:MAG: hypothetical protein ACFE8U_12320, partial [Candidatus Hermodarchaeota archaeon]
MKNLTKTKITDFLHDEFWLLFFLGSLFAFFLLFPFAYSILTFGDASIGIQIILNGVVISVLYAILAMGFSLIYGIAKQLKLSLGGYYVIAAYSMYFLLEAKQIIPGTVPLIDISDSSFKMEGLLLVGLFLLPIVVIIVILLFLWTVFKKSEFLLLLASPIVSGGGFIVIKIVIQGNSSSIGLIIIEGIYIGLAVILIGFAAWYLELPKREIAVGAVILGISLPLLMFLINLNIVYLALMIVAVMFTACLAMLSDRFLIDKIRHSHINVMIVTFAIALFVQNFIQ